MNIEELTQPLGLEDKHFKNELLSVPVINSHLYTTLGRQLFELYESYKINSADQRQIERLSYLLISFTIGQKDKKLAWWRKIFRR